MKIIGLVGKQGRILKTLNDPEQHFKGVALSKSTVYFKTNLYKFVSKCFVLRRSTMLSHYFHNNFRLIQAVCRQILSCVKNSDDAFEYYCFLTFSPHREFFSCCENSFYVARILFQVQ